MSEKKHLKAITKKRNGRLLAIASTEDVDRAGDSLLVKDWDFTNFNNNPVLQAGHDYRPQYTIGVGKNLRIAGKEVLFEPVFHEITPLAKQIKEMYEKGFLKAWSVGFIPAQAKGEKHELLEISAVAVPANQSALMKSLEGIGEDEKAKIAEEFEIWKKDALKETEVEEEEIEDDEITADDEIVETKEAQYISTTEVKEHIHLATYDDISGDGMCDESNDHVHQIKDFEVQETDGHVHEIDLTATGKEGIGLVKKPERKKEFTTPWNTDLPEVFSKGYLTNKPRVSSRDDIYQKFLNVDVRKQFSNRISIPSPMIGNYLSALKEVTKDYGVEELFNMNWDGSESSPEYAVIQLQLDSEATFLVEGTKLCKKGDIPVIVDVRPGWDGMNISIISSEENRSVNGNIIESLHKWVKENNLLKGQKFALSGKFLPSDDASLKDLLLNKGMDKKLKSALSPLTKGDIMQSRGLLFMGPPGTGKTMSGRVIKDTSDATFIWISSADMYRAGPVSAMKLAFSLGNSLTPAVLFFEDIDMWIRDGSVDMLKTEMDGIRKNKGVMTILTTNNPEKLPDSLIDRPGRFHEILEFETPDENTRKEMLMKWVDGLVLSVAETIAKETEGYSGAHMKELVDYASMLREDNEMTISESLIKSQQKLAEQRAIVDRIRSKKEKGFDVDKKVGRVISKKNRKTLSDAKSALESAIEAVDAILTIEEREAEQEMEGKKVTPALIIKKRKKVPLSEGDIAVRTLQRIATVANEGLHKKRRESN